MKNESKVVKKKFSIADLVDTKKKKVIASCITGAIVISTVGCVYAFNQNNTDYVVLKDKYLKTLNVEYGNAIDQKIDTYLNTNDLSKADKTVVLKNSKLVVNTFKNKKATNEKDKEYLAIGSYKLVISYKDDSKTINVKVQDKTAPKIEGVDTIDIVQGTDLNAYDFNSLFTITDLATIETTYDTSAVDVNTVGSYKMKVNSVDANKNEASKEVTINITQAPASDEEIVTETVTNADGTKSVKTTTQKKTTTSSSSSSSTSSSSSGSSSSNNSGSSSNSNTGSSSGGNTSNTGGSTGGSTGGTTTPTTPTKITVYWAKCKDCGHYIESTVSMENVKSQMQQHIDNSNWQCWGYNYGSYQK